MTFTRKKSFSLFSYTLNNCHVTRTSSYKYLGVHLSPTLSWITHIDKISAQASRTLGYLKRNLNDAPTSTKSLAYLAFVRPQLEFASSIWSPHQAYLINVLERVQNRAARFIAKNYSRHASITHIKSSLSLPSLDSRRKIALICLFHKIASGKHVTTLPLSQPTRTSRRLHNNRSFKRIFGRTNAFNSSALPVALELWNGLPDNVVNIHDPILFRHEVTTIFS